MQEFDGTGKPKKTLPGFVLLYANEHAGLPSAWPLAGEQATIGRDGDLRLPVKSVSRKHAHVRRQNGEWILRDLGSRNGTIVDGQRIVEVALEPQAEVRIGDVVMKFVERDAECYLRYRLDGTMTAPAKRLAERQFEMVGGFQVDEICSRLERAAGSPLNILILGETGVGKEVAARDVHRLSGRPGQFIAVNCAAIPANLIESELFGYKKGAFSGATIDKVGLIQTANGGTLFLDEIGDMPLDAQAKLLRVLQTREVMPVGGTKADTVDVRILTATHRDLRALQKEEKFREDLFARVNEYQVRIPALRERKEDIHLLFDTFLRKHGRSDLTRTFRFMTALTYYDWPYNVRELEACAKRAIALTRANELDVSDLPPDIEEAMSSYGAHAAQQESLPEALQTPSDRPPEGELRQLLQQHRGNVAAVGRHFGKARMQVHRWLRNYGIEPGDYRGRV